MADWRRKDLRTVRINTLKTDPGFFVKNGSGDRIRHCLLVEFYYVITLCKYNRIHDSNTIKKHIVIFWLYRGGTDGVTTSFSDFIHDIRVTWTQCDSLGLKFFEWENITCVRLLKKEIRSPCCRKIYGSVKTYIPRNTTTLLFGFLTPNRVLQKTETGLLLVPTRPSHSVFKNNFVITCLHRLHETKRLVPMRYPSHGSHLRVSVPTSVQIWVKLMYV